MADVPPEGPDSSAGGSGGRKESLRLRAVLTTYAVAIQGVARLGFSVLVGNFGSRALLGEANSALAIAVLSSQFGSAAAGQAGTRFVAAPAGVGRHEDAAAVARHIAARYAVTALTVPTVGAALAARFIGFDTREIVWTVVVSLAYSLYVIMRGIQYGMLRYRHVALWDTIASCTALSLTVLVLVFDLTPFVLLPLTLGYLLFAIASWPRRVSQAIEAGLRAEIREFVRYGVVTLVASGGMLQASQLAARWFTDAASAGDYAAALSLATPTFMLASSLTIVLVPPLAAAAARRDADAIRHHGDAIARRMVAIFVGLFGVLVIASPIVLSIFYGPQFVAAERLLPVLLLASMFVSLGGAAAATIQTTQPGGPRAVAVINTVGLLTSILAWFVLGPSHGSVGVAIGYLLGSAVATLAMYATIWRVEHQRWIWLALRLAGGTLAIGVLAWVTHGGTGLAGAAAQLGAAVLFAALWLALVRTDALALWNTVRGRDAL